jgi:hypothetical protein
MSFTPLQLTAEIQKHIPHFSATYQSDFRQQLADSWPNSIDDNEARNHWNWKHAFDLERMTSVMIEEIRKKKLVSSETL